MSNKNPVRYPKPGAAVFFNFIDFDNRYKQRSGSIHDVNQLKTTFFLMDLSVGVFSNLSLQEFRNKIDELSKYDFSEYASFNLVYMSHGDEKNILYCKDGQFNFIEESVKLLRNKTLKDKPSYLIVEACKGKFDVNQIYSCYDGSSEHYGIEITALLTSSFEGYVSYIQKQGSPFIKKLCETIQANWYKDPYGKVLRKILDKATDQQTFCFTPFKLNDKFRFGDFRPYMTDERDFVNL